AGVRVKAQAVLLRPSHHSDTLEFELTRRNIPFVKFGGLKFLEAAHVKDVLACLRFIENPRDRIAGFRVLLLLPGFGPATAARALDQVGGADAAAIQTFAPPARADEAWQPFADLVRSLARYEAGWPAELEQVRRWYQPHLEGRPDD